MPFDVIAKPPGTVGNLADYDAGRAGFSWSAARGRLDGLPGDALNIAHEAVDRHVAAGRGAVIALRWLGKQGVTRDLSYTDLAAATGRFADVLTRLGVGRGECVFSLAGRQPELYIAALGTLKAGAVFSPLFSAFGPEPVRARLERGLGAVLVTTPALYRRKVAPWRAAVASLRHVILIAGPDEELPAGTIRFDTLLAGGDPDFPAVATEPEDMALLHFTSGTTGLPKGAVHVHEAVVAHHVTGHYALDLRPGDIFWCTADPGWVTGTSYGIIAPLTNGATMIVDEAEFDAARWYRTLAEQRVTVWYTAPTAIRMLMKAGDDLPKQYDLSALRFMSSVGEPLNPEAVEWSQRVLGRPFHDNWWQTETGGIMIANFASMDVRPGSMGKPLPGIEAVIVARREDGGVDMIDTPMTLGELALKHDTPNALPATGT